MHLRQEILVISLVFNYFLIFALVDRKLEEKRLKCKEAIDATERIKKENNKLKIEVCVNCYTQNYSAHFLFLSFLFCNEMFLSSSDHSQRKL